MRKTSLVGPFVVNAGGSSFTSSFSSLTRIENDFFQTLRFPDESFVLHHFIPQFGQKLSKNVLAGPFGRVVDVGALLAQSNSPIFVVGARLHKQVWADSKSLTRKSSFCSYFKLLATHRASQANFSHGPKLLGSQLTFSPNCLALPAFGARNISMAFRR